MAQPWRQSSSRRPPGAEASEPRRECVEQSAAPASRQHCMGSTIAAHHHAQRKPGQTHGTANLEAELRARLGLQPWFSLVANSHASVRHLACKQEEAQTIEQHNSVPTWRCVLSIVIAAGKSLPENAAPGTNGHVGRPMSWNNTKKSTWNFLRCTREVRGCRSRLTATNGSSHGEI